MGGGLIKDDQDLAFGLVGETGNVKSATGNSILGSKSFESKRSSSGVTVKSEGKATQLGDGCMHTVKDTPGLFESLVLVEKTDNEISATGNSILGSKSSDLEGRSSVVTVTSEVNATQTEDGRMLNVIDTPGLFDSSADQDSTLVLVGKTGNGKNATGNSNLGSNDSKQSSSGVAVTSEGKATQLEDGRMLNVIDTPGLFGSSADQDLTLVLVGKTGNGKSATGNSILGSKSFDSKRSSSGVTIKSERKATQLENGRMLNVIDTPGLFDSSVDPVFIQNEIVSCIHMAKDGVHGVLVVFSICSRFSAEEQAVVDSLVTLFGSKIRDYMIIVFTGGDELEEDEKSFDDFLAGCSEPLKKILRLCGNRCVLFDNRTKDEVKKSRQVQPLLSYVDTVLQKNDGKPYTSEIFAMFKKQTTDQNESIYLTDKQVEAIIKRLQSKFIEIEMRLQKRLEEEHAAPVKAEFKASKEQKKYKEEIRIMDFKKYKGKQTKNIECQPCIGYVEVERGWCVIM